MSGIKKVLFIFLFYPFTIIYGQETPVNPVANKVFIPYEATGMLSSLGAIKELFTKEK